MLQRLNHIAIVVPDLEKGAEIYKSILGSKVSKRIDLPNHGVSTIFIELENAKIELLHPQSVALERLVKVYVFLFLP